MRVKNLPKNLIAYKGKKEIELELVKRAMIYDFHLHNMLKKKLYEKTN